MGLNSSKEGPGSLNMAGNRKLTFVIITYMKSMPLKTLFLTFWSYLICTVVYSQAIDNMASFRMMNADRYIRLHYENDYFTATDYYYTQGINLESVDPSYKKFPLMRLLVGQKSGTNQFGISIEHNGYTPTSIEHNEILYGDRPFAAALMLKTFSISNNAERRYRITSSLTLGVIGPAAGGYGMQKTIHQWINATVPLGWQNQIQNNVIVNYETGAEKNLLQSSDIFLLNGFANARIGTLNTKLSSGVVLMLGRMNSKIASVFGRNGTTGMHTKKLRFHAYLQPMINAVAYDATLQGGLFNRDSPYTLSSNEISHITFQANYGVVATFNSIYLEYFKTAISKEFEAGLDHRWGGIRVGVKL